MNKILLSLCFLCFSTLYAQSVQTWTSKNGHSFEGTFIRMEGQSVVLKGTDGKPVTVPLTALSEDSQKLAAEQLQAFQKNAPVFSHKNRYLQYSLYADREWLKIEFLEGNRVVNEETYSLIFRLSEVRPPNKWDRVKIKELIGPPEKKRNEVNLRLLMENGVKLKFTVSMDDKAEVEFSFDVEEIPEGLPRLDLQTNLKFPTLLEYNQDTKSYTGPLSSSGVNFEDLPGFLEGYEVKVEHREKDSERILYHEKQSKAFHGSSFTVKVPNKKDVEIQGPKERESGDLSIWFYDGKAAFEGFNIRFLSRNDNSITSGPFTIQVNP